MALEDDPSPQQDRQLLRYSQTENDPAPLLCLRCRVSHPLEAWLRATHRAHSQSHGLELMAMASYALDDDGSLTIRKGPSEMAPFTYAEIASRPAGLISPFTAEVIRTYDPSKCGLPHWARLKIQAHNGLKAYFRENGLLLISDWALLRNSSPRRVREACERHLRTATSIQPLLDLHRRFCPLFDEAKKAYKARTGKASGWQPDLPFLGELAPEIEPFTAKEQLLSIAKAIRQMLSGSSVESLEQAAERGFEAMDPRSLAHDDDGPSPAQLSALINAALERAMDQHMPAVLGAAGASPALLRCLWAGWADGLTNRPLAERCGTSCGTVSKKLRPSEHASAIATAAAVELKRHPAFASCGQSVEAAERLVEALRNHMLASEREGDVAPLRRWVQQYLQQP
ncbi:MAG: hypothetical protein WCQ20_09475 [Synechococcaceae cyanobacterium ELA739]